MSADRRRVANGLAIGGFIAICAVLVAACVTFAVKTKDTTGQGGSPATLVSANSTTAMAAARKSVQQILSYDYRNISSDIATAKADTTGLFAHQYASTASRLLSEARQVKAIVQATVGTSGVVSASASTVVVLLFVDQASVRDTPGNKSPTTRIDQSRVQVTMTKVGNRWLVSKLDPL
jgi:Mce-associated membrane protein